MAKHPTSKNRNKRKRLKVKYSELREEAQLRGLIPTVPEGAIRSEVVDPSTQDEQPQHGILRQAIKGDWSVPDEKKRLIIDKLLEPFEDTSEEVDRYLLKENAKTLILADQRQWERDHPELKKGTEVNVGVQVNNQVDLRDVLRRVREAREAKLIDQQHLLKETSDDDTRAGSEEAGVR